MYTNLETSLATPTAPGIRQQSRLRGLVAAQALVLLGIVGLAYATDHWGQTVRLRTTPVDPRDVLYGDYVRLHYTISELDPGLWRGPGQVPGKGSPVWVVLQESRLAWQPVGLYGTATTAGPGQVVLPGHRENTWTRRISVRYGLERYYLPEGTGPQLEAAARDSAGLLVRVQVAPWGTVRLQGIGQ